VACGAVPDKAQEKNLICVVEGAGSLFVLRKKVIEQKAFMLVSPACVHGLMYGDALDMPEYVSTSIVLL
jgi:hypothetical protein